MATITFQGTHTSRLIKDQDNPSAVTTNYPDTADANIHGSYSGNYRGRYVIQFDASILNSNTITGATLYTYIFDGYSAIGKTLYAYKQTHTDWVYNQATYNIYKTGSNWTSAGGDWVTSNPSGGSWTVGNSTEWASFDMSAIIADAKTNNGGIVNIIMEQPDASGAADCQIRGISYSDSSYRPYLSVTYTATGPFRVKTVNGLAKASVKTVDGLAIASVKSINGLI